MAIHWGLNGQADGYAGKPMASLLLPCVNLAIAVLILILPHFDPKFARYDEETKASLWHTFASMRLAITLFMTIRGAGGVGDAVVSGDSNDADCRNRFWRGLLMIVLGNLMTKLRPNWLYGIRTRWTLESRDVWIKTHRLGGRLMMVGGACILISGLLLPVKLFFIYVLLPAAAVMSIVPIVYSYIVWNRSRSAK